MVSLLCQGRFATAIFSHFCIVVPCVISLGIFDKVMRSNMIMHDLNDTLEILLSEKGMDYGMLYDAEKANNDISAHSFTDRDKKVLLQYKGATLPSKKLCKFLQNNHPACWAYGLYELWLAIQDTGSDTIEVYPGISHTDCVKDLRKHGDKTILVMRSGVEVDAEFEKTTTDISNLERDRFGNA